MDHYIVRCEHGTTVAQCRCPDQNKTVRITACPPACPYNSTDRTISSFDHEAERANGFRP